MVQSHIMNVLPRRLIANLWASQETRISQLGPTNQHHQPSDIPAATSASFLCSELPIRYTHILRLLSSLNPDALQTPLIRNVAQRYLTDICSMLHPSLRHTSPRAFSQTIRRLRQRQASSLIRLRYALASSSTATSHSMMLMDHINAISLGIHFLLDQHVSWHKQTGNQAQVLCPVEVAHQAVNDARKVCADTFGESSVPVVNIKKNPSPHHPLEITHVPNVLHRMLYETTLTALRSHYTQPTHTPPTGWLQRIFGRRPTWSPLQLDVFGGPTSIGYRLTNPAPLLHHDLQHDIPRDPMGVPSCASILRSATHGYSTTISRRKQQDDDDEDHDHAEWSMWSGWRMAKTMASHFGGNLDVVSAEGLGSTMYLALDRDQHLLERYPSVLPNRLSSHQRYASSHLSLQHATSQLDAFLYAVADPNNSIYNNTTTYTTPATHHHVVSLTAAVGHA
ncbi:hypothetical protein BC941DRAFT_491985 [Chlamydoabsidia padenii]|nr:hypothetical protein BC941DRAFT_491985 [Chlamydoabsidia padenii]